MAKNTYFYGLGRRKSSTARVRLYGSGTGKVTINDKSIEDYFDKHETLIWKLSEPLRTVSKDGDFDITVRVNGGGTHSQVGAIQLGIANALADMNDDLRSTLKRAGLLKRDPREKERKKPGLKRARKAEQFSKR